MAELIADVMLEARNQGSAHPQVELITGQAPLGSSTLPIQRNVARFVVGRQNRSWFPDRARILRDQCVGGQQRNALDGRLGDEHPVERYLRSDGRIMTATACDPTIANSS